MGNKSNKHAYPTSKPGTAGGKRGGGGGGGDMPPKNPVLRGGSSSVLKAKQEIKKIFPREELNMLDQVFHDLASRSPDENLMDKATFLKFFDVPGMLGERLFAVFDQQDDGYIDFSEFMTGLALYCKGTFDEKIDVIFRMYDLMEDGDISREELSTMLRSLITPATSFLSFREPVPAAGAIAAPTPARTLSDANNSIIDVVNAAAAISVEEEERTIREIVDQAFETCDETRDNKLHFEEFKKWLRMKPSVVNSLEQVFVLKQWSNPRLLGDLTSSGGGVSSRVPIATRLRFAPEAGESDAEAESGSDDEKQELEPIQDTGKPIECGVCGWFCFYCSHCGCGLVIGQHEVECPNCDSFKEGGFCMQCGLPITNPKRLAAAEDEAPPGSLVRDASKTKIRRQVSGEHVSHLSEQVMRDIADGQAMCEGFLYKKSSGPFGGGFKRRRYMVRDAYLYHFSKKNDVSPKSIVFLEGCFIELPDQDPYVKEGYFGFEIHAPNKTRILYTRSRERRQMWVKLLRRASHTIPVQEFYRIGAQLGSGKYATVHEAVHRKTGKRYAVKVIDKTELAKDEVEREALRAEVAILQLINHPNIIRMKEVFETAKTMYIVMPLIRAGDLFARIVLRKKFSEATTKIVIWRLLSAVKYLHARGIVHRDLKPENILCGSKNDDTQVLIADFGLSQFSAPAEVMNMHCGTISYVAPEVLKMEGYGRGVDIWSIGVIMHVLLQGDLPFRGKNQHEIIKRTLYQPLRTAGRDWADISKWARDLLKSLLEKDPLKRISIEEALQHGWFSDVRRKLRREQRIAIEQRRARDRKKLDEAEAAVVRQDEEKGAAQAAVSSALHERHKRSSNASATGAAAAAAGSAEQSTPHVVKPAITARLVKQNLDADVSPTAPSDAKPAAAAAAGGGAALPLGAEASTDAVALRYSGLKSDDGDSSSDSDTDDEAEEAARRAHLIDFEEDDEGDDEMPDEPDEARKPGKVTDEAKGQNVERPAQTK